MADKKHGLCTSFSTEIVYKVVSILGFLEIKEDKVELALVIVGSFLVGILGSLGLLWVVKKWDERIRKRQVDEAVKRVREMNQFLAETFVGVYNKGYTKNKCQIIEFKKRNVD